MSLKLKVKHLSGREKGELEPLLAPLFPDGQMLRNLMKGDVRVVEGGQSQIILCGKHVLLRKGGRIVPAVVPANEDILSRLPSVKVDRGAVGPIVSGADVMRPGIKVFSSHFNLDDLVVVRDVVHDKALAIGVALQDRETAAASNKGRVLKNIHHVDDREWKLITSKLVGS